MFLRREVVPLCYAVFGPWPGHPQYEEFWKTRGGPPQSHKPPEAPKPKKSAGRKM